MRTETTLTALALACSVAVGCNGLAPDNPKPVSPCDAPRCDEPKPEDDSNEPRDYCTPRARGFAVTAPPELPERFRADSCRLSRVKLSKYGGNYREKTTFETRENGRRIELTATYQGHLQHRRVWFRDADGDVVAVEETEPYHGGEDWDRETTRWELDRKGRVRRIRETTYDRGNRQDPASVRTVRREWSGDEPSGKTILVRKGGETERVRYRWHYDSGRLVRATVRGDTPARTVEWQYEEGRPTRVERSARGDVVERQTWNYDDRGRLETRHVTLDGDGFDGSADPGDWPRRPLLDSMAAGRPKEIYSMPQYAPETTLEPTDRNCRNLPSTVGFGYPEQDPAYRLAWRDAEEPKNVEAVYRWAAYGLSRHLFDGYGHVGAAPDVAPIRRWRATNNRITSRIEYDDRGRMRRVEANSGATEGHGPVDMTRTRTFRDDDLLEDRLVIEAADARQVRTIQFRWDGDRLRQRELEVDGTVVERQTWRHPNRRTSELALSRRKGFWSRQPWPRTPIHELELPEDAQMRQIARFRRVVDDEGRLVEQITPYPMMSSRRSPRETRSRHFTYGPHGPTRKRVEIGDRVDVTTWSYDDRGREIRKTVDRDPADSTETTTRWRYAGDRLVAKTTIDDEGERRYALRRSYRCEQ